MMKISTPDICVKSAAFERFILKRIFPISKYEPVTENHEVLDESQEFAYLLSKSYLRFKSRETGREFYVAARYLTNPAQASIEWCRTSELEDFQEMDASLPLYVVIGFGPQPAAPRHLIMFPVKDIRFNKVLHSYIEKYKISINRAVEETDLV
jgi:hypothetical protein